MLIKEAHAIAGSIGYPSKMPGTSYGLSAEKCITGSKLAQIEGSTCFKSKEKSEEGRKAEKSTITSFEQLYQLRTSKPMELGSKDVKIRRRLKNWKGVSS